MSTHVQPPEGDYEDDHPDASMTPEETWLSVMPPIPLADYQGPVRNPANPEWRAVAVGNGAVYPEWDVTNGWLADRILVPDLDRHEGFGKALRWALDRAGPSWSGRRGMWSSGLISRHLEGQTTHADRLEMTRICRREG